MRKAINRLFFLTFFYFSFNKTIQQLVQKFDKEKARFTELETALVTTEDEYKKVDREVHRLRAKIRQLQSTQHLQYIQTKQAQELTVSSWIGRMLLIPIVCILFLLMWGYLQPANPPRY